MRLTIKFLKGILYSVVGFVILDAVWRAATGRGFSESFGAFALNTLEWAGLVKQKAAAELGQLCDSTKTLFDQFISQQTNAFEKMIKEINHTDSTSVQSLINQATTSASDYIKSLSELPHKLKEIISYNSFVADVSNNLKLAGILGGLLLAKTLHFFYKKGKVTGGKTREQSLKDLTGVYVSTNVHGDYRYYSTDNPYVVGTKPADDAKRSFEKSNLKYQVTVDKGEEVQICYLVLENSSFILKIDGEQVLKKNVDKKNFYVGLTDKRFQGKGEHHIQLLVDSKTKSKEYLVKVSVT